MPVPVLTTKLYIPAPHPGLVKRPRLIARLNEGFSKGRKLTLVSASAGFGKTTLLSEWVFDCGQSVAWLSLDEGDQDLHRFLAYLIVALQTFAEKIGEGVLATLHSSQPPDSETLLGVLLNEIASIPHRFLVILDDYHLLDSRPVDEALTFLLDHQPPQMHLVIATREDPHLPLARLRARGQLTELRTADLRFTLSEAANFLNQMMGLTLTEEEIAALDQRTEGWIAGLQLAAISMQGQKDLTEFIQSFTGSHRFVLDYLVEEVLQRQPEHVGSFLLQTAILDRFCAPLCNAITEREDGKEMLDVLERSNLFLIPLDDQRQWYRYHHLFADVLQTHLMEAQPDGIAALHQRASVWYEQNEMPPDAIHHALAARDFEHAAGLIELAWATMDVSMQSATWLGWTKALPDELIRSRPVLSVGVAWALLDGGEMEACEARLKDAELWLAASADKPVVEMQMVVTDEEQFRSLPASISTARAYRSLAMGDIAATVEFSRQALELTPQGDQIRRNQAIALLGLAQYASGDLEGADHSLSNFQTSMRQAGDISTAVSITFTLAEIKAVCGHLREAIGTYQQALQLAASQGEPLPIGTADLHRGISEFYLERGDLEAAAQHLSTGKKLGEQVILIGWKHRLCTAEARFKQAQGDLAGALALLAEAKRLYVRGPLPDIYPIPALEAQIWIAQGNLNEALLWAREHRLAVDDKPDFLGEFERLTFARLLVARYQSERDPDSLKAAIALLERLRAAAEAGRRNGSLIKILVVQALAHQAGDDISQALTALERALALAEPEGYFRVFVDEGEPLRPLMETLKASFEQQPGERSRPLLDYLNQLLAGLTPPAAIAGKPRVGNQPAKLVEPLSERELEVLRLLRSELSGPEIALELIISLNTLRTHTKNIYHKLNVNNRRAAIRHAKELDLL